MAKISRNQNDIKTKSAKSNDLTKRKNRIIKNTVNLYDNLLVVFIEYLDGLKKIDLSSYNRQADKLAPEIDDIHKESEKWHRIAKL